MICRRAACRGGPRRLGYRFFIAVRIYHGSCADKQRFELVAADIYTAPSARAFLARVKKVNNTRLTLANAIALGLKVNVPQPDHC